MGNAGVGGKAHQQQQQDHYKRWRTSVMASGFAMSPAGKLVILAVTATVNMQAHHHRGNRKTSRRHVSTAATAMVGRQADHHRGSAHGHYAGASSSKQPQSLPRWIMILTVTAMGSGATASAPHAHHQADRSRISTASATHQQRSRNCNRNCNRIGRGAGRIITRRLVILAVADMITRQLDHPWGNGNGRQESASSSR